VPAVFERAGVPAENSVALVIDPPITIKDKLPVLNRMEILPSAVNTSLENRMRCREGKYGHCNVGSFYVCKGGPILTMDQLERLPADY
jgi:NAD(P)H-flavin reductase